MQHDRFAITFLTVSRMVEKHKKMQRFRNLKDTAESRS